MWNNTDELPDDKIDNDNNGFVDDINGWNFVDDTNELFNTNFQQEDYHGTMCAGIIATTTNEISRYRSTNKSLKIMSLKVLNSRNEDNEENVGSIGNLIKAIKYAENNGASICNISLNTYQISDELDRTIKQSQMLFIVSAGNSFPRGINIDKVKTYPACYNYNNVITVSSIDANNNIEVHSNYGKDTVDVFAPGTDILSTSVYNTYSSATGTSMATPIVAGIAAEIYMCYPKIKPDEAKEIICGSAEGTISSDDNVGINTGIINGKNALKLTKSIIENAPKD